MTDGINRSRHVWSVFSGAPVVAIWSTFSKKMNFYYKIRACDKKVASTRDWDASTREPLDNCPLLVIGPPGLPAYLARANYLWGGRYLD